MSFPENHVRRQPAGPAHHLRHDVSQCAAGKLAILALLSFLALAACQRENPTPTPGRALRSTTAPTAKSTHPPPPSPTALSTAIVPALTSSPTAPAMLALQEPAGSGSQPTLVDFWEGRAEFVVDVADTGLPMGESDTIVMSNGEFWSYLHASQRSAGVVDSCGDPVPFPGCTVIYKSFDGGQSFRLDSPPVCQFSCVQCPCRSEVDHVEQQQYPRVFYDGDVLWLVYEYLGRVMLRRSPDAINWSGPERIARSGIWKFWLRGCPPAEQIGQHPYVPYDYECLAGGPPGIYVEDDQLFIFMAVGQNPGGMGCYRGEREAPAASFTRCFHNPLFAGAAEYGPPENGPSANPYFDFRTISAADVYRIGAGRDARYYLLYEGIRGPGPGDPGDSQFGLGLARSLTGEIDGPWETFPGNPILVDLPGNIGLGHADLVIHQGRTLLYTSLDGEKRSRLSLEWISG